MDARDPAHHAQAYGYEGRYAKTFDDAAWASLGAIRNNHAIGDQGTPWPKWHPHADMLLPAVRRVGDKIEDLPDKWLPLYEHTRASYRYHLRETFLPLALHHKDRALAKYLKTRFEPDWHVNMNGEGGIIQREGRAMHRLRYSCRPLSAWGRPLTKKAPRRSP